MTTKSWNVKRRKVPYEDGIVSDVLKAVEIEFNKGLTQPFPLSLLKKNRTAQNSDSEYQFYFIGKDIINTLTTGVLLKKYRRAKTQDKN